MNQPDYHRIAQLERELGLTEPLPPRRPVTRAKVCLTKNCDGDWTEITTWGSPNPVLAIHTCRPPA